MVLDTSDSVDIDQFSGSHKCFIVVLCSHQHTMCKKTPFTIPIVVLFLVNLRINLFDIIINIFLDVVLFKVIQFLE